MIVSRTDEVHFAGIIARNAFRLVVPHYGKAPPFSELHFDAPGSSPGLAACAVSRLLMAAGVILATSHGNWYRPIFRIGRSNSRMQPLLPCGGGQTNSPVDDRGSPQRFALPWGKSLFTVNP